MDLKEYRESPQERKRLKNLISLIPEKGGIVLDVGARDGFFSSALTDYFNSVLALDLEKPNIDHPKIESVKGDIRSLEFSDNKFDLVFCVEVLEHVSPNDLKQACVELKRVTKKHLIIGVPYKQDIRAGRSTCSHCGGKNPPWGHVNSFDEFSLEQLFLGLKIIDKAYVGETNTMTNFISTFLMDFAGNPYGTYLQEEDCIHCSKKLMLPSERNLIQKIATKLSINLTNVQRKFVGPHPNWIHVVFSK